MEDEDSPLPMNIATMDRFVEWLQQHKDLNAEDLKTHLMHGFQPPHMRSILYFQSDRERYLRRDVVDKYLRGEEVNQADLREAVYYLCTAISQMSDAVHRANKRKEKRRIQKPPRHSPYGKRASY